MADRITVTVKDAELIEFIEKYAKQVGVETGEATARLLKIAKGRVKALVNYAKKLAADAPAKAPKAAKAKPQKAEKKANAQPRKAKAKAPKVVKAAEPAPAPEAAAQ